ncbi:MAG: Type 1 glutamine amidotransferase-like domain-containing protein [Candidatus Nomurabacteria bacterium]|jgi:dipeptidase E|nr:Type 1 glutamine amidotransferase-like domain-containing protein [Candidatus Nomurabacteria bacterium]
MKAILFSSDFAILDATTELERLVGKPAKDINFVIINEGFIPEKGDDNSFFVDGMHFIKHHFGNFYLLNLQAMPKEQILERIEKSDAFFCFGGTSGYLMKVLNESGLAEELPALLKDRVWCGSSAGSMVFGYAPSKKLSKDLWGGTEFEDKKDWGVDKYMEFAPVCILAHMYGGDLSADPHDFSVIKNSATMSVPVYALSDWSAVVVDGDDIKCIGEHWTKCNNGVIVENQK